MHSPSRMKYRHIACDHSHISRKALVAYKMLFSSKLLLQAAEKEAFL